MAFEALERAWLPRAAIRRTQVEPYSGRLHAKLYYSGLSGTQSPGMS